MSATAQDVILGALRRINSYQPGDQLAPLDASDCLSTFNDLLDSFSTDKNSIYGTNENILAWTAGQNTYTVGNPLCTDLGDAPFTGTVTGGSNVITGVSPVPSNLIAGATLTDVGAVIPAGTTVESVGTNSVTMTANASATPAVNPDSITYTIPGNFAIPRPLRITSGFTRFNNLDFTLDVYETQERFNEILYKAQPGPWPTVAWYNPVMPYGILKVYQTPGNNAALYLYTDTILANLTLYQTINWPQGYTRAFKWLLAKEICTEYGFPLNESIKTMAAESLKMIQALNAKPAQVSRYDRMLTRGNRPDGGWVITGGYG